MRTLLRKKSSDLDAPTAYSTDVAEDPLKVTDIKQYFYCPRIIYFDKVLHLPQKTLSQQEESRQQHIAMARKETRRKGAVFYDSALNEAEKLFQLPLESEKLGLKGVLDCLIHTPNGEYIPVDYKYQSSDHGRMHLHHKYQLIGYSLLVDENYGTNVRRGFIYYANEEKTIPLEITFDLKKYLARTIQKIKDLIAKQQEPAVKACPAACGYEWICDAYPVFHK